MSLTAVLAGGDYEYVAEPTDGVSLSDGTAWWGVYVKYRRLGTRKWQRFSLIDVHSWDTAAITAAIEHQASPAPQEPRWAWGKLANGGIRICSRCGDTSLEDEMHLCPAPQERP